MENKQFRLKRIHSQIRRLLPVLFLLFAIGLMTLWQTKNPVVVSVRLALADKMAPVASVLSAPARWMKSGKDAFLNAVFLYQRNEVLEQENKTLRRWRALALQLQAEQNEIKKMVNYVSYPKSKAVVARIVMDVGDKFSRSYIALAGHKQGLRNGTVALTDKGLFARVIEVGENATRLMSLTDYLSRVPVVVGSKRIPAILAGDNTLHPKIIFTEQLQEIQPNDVILTSGYMGVYPAGLNVGLIRHVSEEEVDVDLFETGEQVEFVQLVDFGLSDSLLKNECQEQ